MAWLQNKNQRQRNFLYCFQHKYSFCVPNFSEIISLEMKNFRARLGKRSGQGQGQGQGFLWGNYELCVLYRRFAKGEEVTEKKVFPRSFSTFLDTLPFPAGENLVAEKIIFTCVARYNTSIAPLFLTFFPLLGRLDYLPFKISVEVIGDIFSVPYSAPTEQESSSWPEFFREVAVKEAATAAGELAAAVKEAAAVAEVKEKKFLQATGEENIYLEKIVPMEEEFLPDKGLLGEQEVTKEEAPTASFTVNVPFRGQAVSPEIMPKENKDEQGGDLIAREKKRKARMREPSPDPRYYKTYRLFYEHFFPEPPAGGSPFKKKTK